MNENEKQEYKNKFLELREEARIIASDYLVLEFFTDQSLKSILKAGLDIKKQNISERYNILIQEVIPKYGLSILFEII